MVSANQKLGNGPESAGGEEPQASQMGNQKGAAPEGAGPAEGEQYEDETLKYEVGLIGIPGL